MLYHCKRLILFDTISRYLKQAHLHRHIKMHRYIYLPSIMQSPHAVMSLDLQHVHCGSHWALLLDLGWVSSQALIVISI